MMLFKEIIVIYPEDLYETHEYTLWVERRVSEH